MKIEKDTTCIVCLVPRDFDQCEVVETVLGTHFDDCHVCQTFKEVETWFRRENCLLISILGSVEEGIGDLLNTLFSQYTTYLEVHFSTKEESHDEEEEEDREMWNEHIPKGKTELRVISKVTRKISHSWILTDMYHLHGYTMAESATVLTIMRRMPYPVHVKYLVSVVPDLVMDGMCVAVNQNDEDNRNEILRNFDDPRDVTKIWWFMWQVCVMICIGHVCVVGPFLAMSSWMSVITMMTLFLLIRGITMGVAMSFRWNLVWRVFMSMTPLGYQYALVRNCFKK